ncbi:MAG: aldehyde ferredoxin oxidoreductase N-terminal domain-containing protein [Candidatus Hydrogenedentes bacterium]|nr:aldehyde ferredoxin oxidoreductase N-terminal domain-containing protein [Candidatus Hydrogenedentota bacterium]
MKILRIDMSALTSSLEDLPEEWTIIGGRALSAKILNKEVSPDTDPLGADARLVFAIGPLAGTMAPSFGRMSVGGKSPLTMGIKEANVGGSVAQKIDKLGVRAIIVQGAPSDGKLYIMKFTKDGVTFEDAGECCGMGNYALVEVLKEKHGKKVGIMSIGVAGERKQKSASVALTDKDGLPTRHAARGGLGAVMGAKGLKAIVVDETGVKVVVPVHKEVYRAAVKAWPEPLKANRSFKTFAATGTAGVLGVLSRMGSTPMQNYSGKPPEGIENLFGENIMKDEEGRGHKMDACMQGCIVKCSLYYNDKDGNHVTSALEYETLALMGTNLGVSDPDAVALFDRMCDDIGIDTIEIGSALGVAASAGKFAMGDAAAVEALLKEIEEGTEMGRMIADGVVHTALTLGVDRVPAFGGQAIPAHDPRVGKPTGVTYHTSPMGADHTAGLKYEMDNEGAVEHSLREQITNAVLDSIGLCQFAIAGETPVTVTFCKDLLNACYGLEITEDDVVNIGRDCLRDEVAFNKGAEFSTVHGDGPAFVRTEVLPPMNMVFGVEQAEMDKIWDNLDTISVI